MMVDDMFEETFIDANNNVCDVSVQEDQEISIVEADFDYTLEETIVEEGKNSNNNLDYKLFF